MSSIDILAKKLIISVSHNIIMEFAMTSSLHVSLPDEMRAYVDIRTNGKQAFATPSEYVRSLIRNDMERESERLYVFKELLNSAEEIKNRQFYSADEVEELADKFLDELAEEDKK